MTAATASSIRFAQIAWRGQPISIEYEWIDADDAASGMPVLVFLHEGLGSRSMWRDFPQRLCDVVGMPGLVFSRPGYGASTPRHQAEPWDTDYLHRQAHEVLPALFDHLGLSRESPPWLLGHSDGGTIALLYAARFPGAVAGLVLLAPHVFVESISVTNIEAARKAYAETDLRERLAKHHLDVDATFRGWNDIWLHRDFRAWNIESEIEGIECPVLAIQGRDDEYGTMAQLQAIRARVPSTRIVELADCRHSPHRDQPEPLIETVAAFLRDTSTTEKR